MPTLRSTAILAPMCCALFGACSADEPADTPIPERADSGFSLVTNAFAFENFTEGYESSEMTPSSMALMFGDAVCSAKTPECQLTPVARVWMNKTNAAMAGGRCEGFAVLSSLLFSGNVDPVQYGASAARQLTLDSNVPLQEALAYWFATQGVPAAVKTEKHQAKDALRFLSTFLQPDATEFYRIGIVRKTARGLVGGHAVTPIRYEPTAVEGVYALHVYDNNFPDEDRTMKIDVVRGEWEYRAAANPDEPSALYHGNATDQNPLYFASINTRQGVLPMPFGSGTQASQTTFQGAVSASAHDEAGNAAGIGADGNVVETGAGRVSPSFSVPSTWTGLPPVDVSLPAGDTTIDMRAGDGAAAGTITQVGAGYAVQLAKLRVNDGGDAVRIAQGGRAVAFENVSRTEISMLSSVQAEGGRALEVQVDVPAGGGRVTTQVDPISGQIRVTANGTTGSSVALRVTKVEVGGATSTAVATVGGAESNTITIDANAVVDGAPLVGQQDKGDGIVTPLGDLCADGQQSGLETDVDCGGTCSARCFEGQGCFSASDCASFACNVETSLCVATQCDDASLSPGETDVDCGGSCGATCALGRSCTQTSDCATGQCNAGTCALVPVTDDRYVFVTSAVRQGNFGGIAGGDALCQDAATAGGLPGTYRSFLSDSTSSAASRIGRGVSRYVLVDATSVVAVDAQAFFSDTHLRAIDRTETNAALSGAAVWTGSQGNGFGDGTTACADWTSTADAQTPQSGSTDFADARWMTLTGAPCTDSKHLYCVQEGPNFP